MASPLDNVPSLATVSGSGDYTLQPGEATAAGGAASFAALASQPGGVSNDQAIGALSASAAALSGAAVMLAGSSAAGPVGVVFGAVLAATEALVALDPASGGPPGLTPAQAYAAGYTLQDFGVSPIWYDTPGPGGTTVGNGPPPSYAPGTFEAFAEALLIADYEKNVSREAWILHAQPYNFARWPAIVAMAAASWNATHASTGTPKMSTSLQSILSGNYLVPNTGGSRSVCVEAIAAPAFGGKSTGVVPASTTALSTAIWLAQYTPADWASPGSGGFGGGPINAQLMIGDLGAGQLDVAPHLGEGKTICVTVNNGALLPTHALATAAATLSAPANLQPGTAAYDANLARANALVALYATPATTTAVRATSSSSSSTTAIVVGTIVLAVAGGAAVYFLKVRRRRNPRRRRRAARRGPRR